MGKAAKIAMGMIVFILILLAIYWAGTVEGLDMMKEASGP